MSPPKMRQSIILILAILLCSMAIPLGVSAVYSNTTPESSQESYDLLQQPATTIATFTGTGQGENIYSRYYSNYVVARVFKMDVGGTIYEGFCIDLYTTIRVGNTLLVDGPLTEDARENIDWCAVNYIIHTYGDRSGPGALPNTNTEAAAIQAAIWYLTTEPYGGSGPPGPYHFMNDTTATTPYDAYRQSNPRDTVRNRANQILNAARPGGTCTFKFPVSIRLTPKLSDIAPDGSVDITATVYDQDSNPLSGIGVEFVNSGPGGGTLSDSSGITDANGNVTVTFTASSGNDFAYIDAYVTGNYGTFMFDPGENRQSVTSLTLVPYSITDRAEVFWEPNPSIKLLKEISHDNQTWVANDTPIDVVEGDDIFYRFVVMNDGNVTLTNIQLTDDQYTLSCTPPASLAPMETFECYLGPYSALAGVHCNNATANGTYIETVKEVTDKACYNGTPVYTKSGRVFITVDGEVTGIGDVSIWICKQCGDSFPVSTVAVGRTDANGDYLVPGLTADTYNVSIPRYTGDATDNNEWLFDNYQPVIADPVRRILLPYEPFEVIAREFSVGPNSTGNDFEFVPLGSIGGKKFDDLNGNGVWDINEGPLSGWTIRLTYPNGTVINQVTQADGSYLFAKLPYGTYILDEVVQDNWEQTKPVSPSYYTVELSEENLNVIDRDFGNLEEPDCCACAVIPAFTYKRVGTRTYKFTDTSRGDVRDWYWDFGDRSSNPERYERNPTHQYSRSGYYYVKLYVKQLKCDDTWRWTSKSTRIRVT